MAIEMAYSIISVLRYNDGDDILNTKVWWHTKYLGMMMEITNRFRYCDDDNW